MRNFKTKESVLSQGKLSTEERIVAKELHDFDTKNSSVCKNNEQREEDADASTTSVAEEHEWNQVRHPRLPITTPPRYFVNKLGVIRSNATAKLKLLGPNKKASYISYKLYVDKKQTSFKLDEIMAATFSGQQYDKSKHYIYHKDGNQKNCAWDNLIVCDLPTLQAIEIERLQEKHSGTKYTVVRNVHDTLTFELYLVSDAGRIYSLASRKHLSSFKDYNGYQMLHLFSDAATGKIHRKGFSIVVHSIVLQSFKGRRVDNLDIDHFSGEKADNSLKNLEFVTRSINNSRSHGPLQTETRNLLKEQGDAPKRDTVRPLPPVTEETKWEPVGTLPWNGRSFSKYEVSNMGHVRKIGNPKLLTLSCTSNGYIFVKIPSDQQVVKSGCLDTTRIRVYDVIVSRLVANAFVEGYSETQNVVKHLNGDRQDNRAQNLEWVTTYCSTLQKSSRKVVVALVDDPKARKEFPSMSKAQRELHTRIIKVQYGNTIRKEVDWDGTLDKIDYFTSDASGLATCGCKEQRPPPDKAQANGSEVPWCVRR
ncbi:hypothetical protein BJV82DRAFT_697877 [Fennellomyces sp. T-0311]|nr:hypothetical protein BJV82DRAFT_697877 [Fennellomyces sp. T-0311]